MIPKLRKKGQVFQTFGALAVGVATLAITLIVVFIVISQGRAVVVDNNPCHNLTDIYNSTDGLCYAAASGGGVSHTGLSAGFNATQTLGESVDTIPGWVPLIIIAGIGVAVLGLVRLLRN